TSVDYVIPDEKLRCVAPTYEPGGGGINVARAIRKLGGEALALFPAGGPAGQLLVTLLDGEGVRHRAIPIAAWTRENLNALETVTGRQFRFLMPGAALVEVEWQIVLATLAALTPSPRYLVVSGSLAPGVPVDFYARVAESARRSGIRLILDTSGEPLRRALETGVYMLKPSLHEFEELTGEANCDESRLPLVGRRLIEQHRCELLVLSLGARGILWMSASERGRLASPAVPVRSSVGAGDSTVAGIVLALARGQTLREAIAFGVAAGAASVMNPGTELCHPEDVARLYTEITAGPASPSSS
ncbi:MAG TPA: 1-phosphofructokinase family hexose kinase, partial [Candidatus Binatia bacterium]|nr:1-phosphofructokinase family hexose kinase [Candidatus Binatia bacterium]